MVRLRMTHRAIARLLVALGAGLAALGVGMVYRPAGVIVAGTALVLFGLFLVDVEGARELGTTRSPRSRT